MNEHLERNCKMTSHWSTEYTSAEYHDLQANAMAISIDGQMAVLAGRRCYMFVKLSKGIEVTKKVSRHSKWDVNVAQWNPHITHQQMFAAACNQRIDVWNLAEAYDKISVSLKGHSRVISDIDWSLADPNMLASCSVDTFAHIWDLRDGRRPAISLQAVSGSSQVKWNKRKHSLLATAHDSDVRIWDPRNSSSPVKYIAAHLSKIHGLDWSSQDENHMATSSQDGTVKLWHTGNNKEPESKLSLSFPVWRARYTPFARGLLTALVPQLRRGENGVSLWNLDDLSQPVHTFLGHTDVMLEFQWKKAADSSDYQLITWSKDQTLRIWNVGARLQQLCGFLSKQESLLSRIEAMNNEKVLESSSEDFASGTKRNEHNANAPDITDASVVGNTTVLTKSTSDNTLVQEFNLLNQSISNVIIEEFDATKRRCAVQVVSDKLSVTLDMEFPDAYPNQTPPKFSIRESNLGTKAKSNQLVQMLRDTAIQHVKHNRTCVEPCLRQLATTVDKLAESMLLDLVGSFPVSASPNAHQLGSSYMSSMYGVSPPLVLPIRPRVSGARFGGPGYLICFTAVEEGSSSSAPDVVRVVNNRVAGQPGGSSRIPSFHYHLAHSPPETSSVAAALSVKRGSIKTRNRTRTESRDITTTPKRQQQQAQAHKIGPVIVYDISCLMAANRQLAETYSLDTSDIGKMCTSNAKAAADVNRLDLVQTWTIAALTYKNIVRSTAANGEEPWLENPFGRELVQSLLTHYAKLGDIQTLAMLSCLFSWKVNISSSPAVHAGKTLQDQSPDNYNQYHTIHATEASILWAKKMAAVAKMKRCNSYSEVENNYVFTLDEHDDIGGDVVTAGSGGSNGGDVASPSSLLLDWSEVMRCDNYKRAYADLLLRWRLVYQRAEVLKHLHVTPEPHKGIEFGSQCQHCNKETRGVQCWHCKRFSIECAVCHITVKGLSAFCLACGHGGHSMHIITWFQQHAVCPSGCGCYCLKENVFSSDPSELR